MSVRQRSITADNPPTAIANDGKTVLRRYRVDGVIYARTVQEARKRLRGVVGTELDDALIVPPSKGRKKS